MLMERDNREGAMGALRVIDLPEPALGLELPGDLTFEQWESEGRRLSQANHALQWYIGDWWNAGEKFGDERRADTAKRFFGLEYQRIRDIGWVAGKFEVSCRHDSLPFTHHQEVASLPREAADLLLAQAEQEQMSKRELRSAVQALKAANDPQQGPVEVEQPPTKPLPQQSIRADLLKAYEMVIEFADALQVERKLNRREEDMLTVAQAFVAEARDGTRTASPPADFEIIFREKGRLACEEHYNVARVTVNHWLIALGKKRLIDERAAFVRFQRDQVALVRAKVGGEQAHALIADAMHGIAVHAAHYLRISRFGGWRISSTGDGAWFVGTVRKSSDELIAMAERQGFDSEAARLSLLASTDEAVEA